MPTVSVIMPIYNGARYLSPAIQSLLAQTWQDWELVAVNDGSTDATPDILKSFSDPRIVTLHQKNQGEAVARNTGLENARGKYLGFLDADDLYLPNALADLVDFMEKHPETGVVLSDGYVCDSDENPLMRLTEHRPGIYTGNILEPLILSPGVVTVPVCTLTRRSIVEENHFRFDRELVIGPDYDFWIQLARITQFGYLDKLTCKYRIHQTNIQHTSGRKRRREDLVRGRVKILNADWFQDLSSGTRHAFFYHLLVFLLHKDLERQNEIIQSPQFQAMPAHVRATLLRNMANEYLLEDANLEYARGLLEAALEINPADRKSSMTIKLLDTSRPACRLVLRGWKAAQIASASLHMLGQKKSKPLPSSLLPTAE